MGDRQRIRVERTGMDAGPLQGLVDSFLLHLASEGKSDRTKRTYTEAARWLAAVHLRPAGIASWDDVTRQDVQRWMAHLSGTYSQSYASNQFRALQQFFRWYATEDEGDPRPSPMAGMKPPRVTDDPVPLFTAGELARLIGACKGAGFRNRRDTAILTLFRDTGIRLAEMAGLRVEGVSLHAREATVTGKGGKTRTVKFSFDAAVAIDRYLRRDRAQHPHAARSPMLWLGLRGRMTDSGIYQMIKSRGAAAGVEVNPHKFRHHFSHAWLDAGGADGDLMELNGWESPQMLRRYGRSAASARARRHYDQVMSRE